MIFPAYLPIPVIVSVPVVYDNGKKLKKGTDYQVTYVKNTKEDVGVIGGEGNLSVAFPAFSLFL